MGLSATRNRYRYIRFRLRTMTLHQTSTSGHMRTHYVDPSDYDYVAPQNVGYASFWGGGQDLLPT
eukprot:146557-Amphidinium_carterae.1